MKTRQFRNGQVVKFRRGLGVTVKKLGKRRWRILSSKAELIEMHEDELTPGLKQDRQKLNSALAKIV